VVRQVIETARISVYWVGGEHRGVLQSITRPLRLTANLPGASPATMAATVATPFERHLGIVADVIGMSSERAVGITRITLQFSLNRSLDGAARDVQAAINAARVACGRGPPCVWTRSLRDPKGQKS
jgi:hypothetical protein